MLMRFAAHRSDLLQLSACFSLYSLIKNSAYVLPVSFFGIILILR